MHLSTEACLKSKWYVDSISKTGPIFRDCVDISSCHLQENFFLPGLRQRYPQIKNRQNDDPWPGSDLP